MKQISIFLCSPHKCGVTDALGFKFYEGARNTGTSVKIYPVRDYAVSACIGCGSCSVPPHHCILDKNGDQAEELFAILRSSDFCLFTIPIYFYAMPAHFKAFIDRGQRFWEAQMQQPAEEKEQQTAAAILAAGRIKGKLLFSATLRTLRWFLKILNIRLTDSLTLRGLNDIHQLSENIKLQKKIVRYGEKWGKKITANE